MIALLLLGALWHGPFAFATSPETLAKQIYWRKLLHFEGSKSLVTSPDFFVSPQGPHDPLAELQADISAFADPGKKYGPLKLSAQCAFPERFRFLRSALSLSLPAQDCSDFLEWKTGLGAFGATLVFSSSYPNNPASLFGHLLLRLDRQNSMPLQDYGVSFAANIPEDASKTEYVIYGLTGGFPGFFSLSPYYEKIAEYNNSESRDLWEYKLKLSPSQTQQMVNHLWELYATAYFDYFFLSQNCAYQILALLEVANPEWQLTSQFPWYVIPADAVHALQKAGSIELEPKLRLSAKKQFLAKKRKLSGRQQQELSELLFAQKQSQDAAVLEAGIAYYHFKKFQSADLIHSQAASREQELLLSRARLGLLPLGEEIPESHRSQPNLGHFSSNAGLSSGWQNGNFYWGPFYHLGVQDLVQSDIGFTPYQEIALGHLNLQYVPSLKKLRLGSAKVIQITSLTPWEKWDPKISWSLAIKVEPPSHCTDCQALKAGAGAGWSVELLSEKLLFYQLLEAQAEWSSHFSPGNFWLGPALRNGILAAYGAYKTQWQLQLRHNFLLSDFGANETKWLWDQSFRLSQSWDLESAIEKSSEQQDWNGQLRVHYFF